MNLFRKFVLALVLALPSIAANAELYSFTYTFDGCPGGTAGHELVAIVDGELQADRDTILINNFVTASLAGNPYNISSFIGIRAANFGDAARMSVSGNTLDFWVCVQGFTGENPNVGGGDCPFGAEGGFMLIDTPDVFGWAPDGVAHAGIPELGAGYRDSDRPINTANWQVEQLSTVRLSFSYTFDAVPTGNPGDVLSGVVDGFLLDDNDTLEIVGLREASLAGIPYVINGGYVGLRASDPAFPPTMSLSGANLDFWICPLGFSQVNGEGGDCPFGAEGGFLIIDKPDVFEWAPLGVAHAGIPELGNSFRNSDRPVNLSNWSASIVKVKKPKKPKKPKKSKK